MFVASPRRRTRGEDVRAKTEHIEHVISVSRNDPRNRFQLLVNRFQLLVDVL